jgi:Lon protease-like protein
MPAPARLGRLPLFPLAQVVLFPRTRVPLHVFEPRYRQMTRDALASDARLGMIAVPPEHADAMAANPPLYSVGCAGSIADLEHLPDGRFQFVLVGTQRFRLLRELEGPAERLYRMAEVEWLDDPRPAEDDPEPGRLRGRTLSLLRTLLERSGQQREFPVEQLERRLALLDVGTFADALCQALWLPTPDKQGLLEATGALARLERLAELLRFRLAQLEAPAGPQRVH